jgi:hypothetical protein
MSQRKSFDFGTSGTVAVLSFATLLATLVFMFQTKVLQTRSERFVQTTGAYFLVRINVDEDGQGRQLVFYNWSVAGNVYADQYPTGRGWAPADGPFGGDKVTIWYDPQNPQDHHRHRMPAIRDAERLRWISAALAVICAISSGMTLLRWLKRPGRSWLRGE